MVSQVGGWGREEGVVKLGKVGMRGASDAMGGREERDDDEKELGVTTKGKFIYWMVLIAFYRMDTYSRIW